MKIPALSYALLACAMLARADTVEIKAESSDPDAKGLKLEGKVVRDEKDEPFIVFAVYNESGRVPIPRYKIKNLDYDMDSMLAKVGEDDYAGRYKVALWAVEHGKLKEAIKLFEQLVGKDGVGDDMDKRMAEVYEKRHQLDKALVKYSDYLKLHPDDTESADKVEKLKKEVNPEPEPGPETKNAQAKSKVEPGLEEGGTWVVEPWGHPGSAQVMPDEATGGKVVAVRCQVGKEKDKAAISRVGQPLNLADSKEMVFKVSHTCEGPVKLAIAFCNTLGDDHEAEAKRVPPKTWMTFKQPLDGKIWKSNRNEWKAYNLDLEGRDNIKRIRFMVYTDKPFDLYLESIYFK
ncbi:MAG: hypothetical protein ABSE73_20215 [Planctomycetota bacterium]